MNGIDKHEIISDIINGILNLKTTWSETIVYTTEDIEWGKVKKGTIVFKGFRIEIKFDD